MTWEDDVAQATQLVEDALYRALYKLNEYTPVKWVLSFEYITREGVRDVASMASADLMKWDVQGLLHHVLKNDDLDTLRQVIRGDNGG